jgi:hypothetical protein
MTMMIVDFVCFDIKVNAKSLSSAVIRSSNLDVSMFLRPYLSTIYKKISKFVTSNEQQRAKMCADGVKRLN